MQGTQAPAGDKRAHDTYEKAEAALDQAVVNATPLRDYLETVKQRVLQANKELLDAIGYIDGVDELLTLGCQYTGSTNIAKDTLATVSGAVLCALDELEHLDVPGFKHPDHS